MLPRKRNYNYIFLILGFLCLFGGIFLFTYKYYNRYYLNQKEKENIDNFFQQQIEQVTEPEITTEEINSINDNSNDSVNNTVNYIAVIEIPKISLKKGLVDKESNDNNINKNIQILKESDFPDQEKGNFILVAHAGNSYISFFRNISKLEEGDLIYIYYNYHKYVYQVSHKYNIKKTGQALISRDKNKKTLTLITCQSGTDQQIVIVSDLIREEMIHGI